MTESHWYCLAADGQATLCVDHDDAFVTAAEADTAWPGIAPHRAVQLVAVQDLADFDEASARALHAGAVAQAATEQVEKLEAALNAIIEDMEIRARIRGDVENGIAVLDISDGVLDQAHAALAQEQGESDA